MLKPALSLALILVALPALADVSGQFVAGKRPPIKPKYAAAYETRDQRDARKRTVEVILSEVPVDMAQAIGELDPHSDIINQKGIQGSNYILLWVRPGNDVSMNATYSETMTQFVDMTGGRMKAEIKTLTADAVAGHLWMTSPAKTGDEDTYMVDVTFSAPITRTPAGTKLGAGGGDPGKALQSLFAAISKKSWAGIRSGVSDRALKSFYYDDRSEQENLDDALTTFGIWLPKKAGKITGGELRGDTAILEMEAEMFEGTNGLFLVKMVKSGPRWVFDRATRAGFID